MAMGLAKIFGGTPTAKVLDFFRLDCFWVSPPVPKGFLSGWIPILNKCQRRGTESRELKASSKHAALSHAGPPPSASLFFFSTLPILERASKISCGLASICHSRLSGAPPFSALTAIMYLPEMRKQRKSLSPSHNPVFQDP